MNTSEGAQCSGKIKHEKRSGAVGQIVNLKKRYGDTDLEPYVCPHCGFWHVGHRTQRTKHKRRGGMYK